MCSSDLNNGTTAKVLEPGTATTSFIAYQAGDYTVTAGNIQDTLNAFTVYVVNGTQSGNYITGIPGVTNIYTINTPVTIVANTPQPGYVFKEWIVEGGPSVGSGYNIGSTNSSTTTFTAGIGGIGIYTITATYENPTKYFTLLVGNRATITTNQPDPQGYPLGTVVGIQANDPESNEVFVGWKSAGDPADIQLEIGRAHV